MQQKHIWYCVLIAVSVVFSSMMIISENDYSDGEYKVLENRLSKCDLGICLLSEDQELYTQFGKYSNITLTEDPTANPDVFVIGKDWIISHGSSNIEGFIAEKISIGTPTILLGIDDTYLKDKMHAVVETRVDGTIGKAYFKDGSGTSYSYSVVGEDVCKSLPYFTLWADMMLKENREILLTKSSWISDNDSRLMDTHPLTNENGAIILGYESITKLFDRGTTTLSLYVSKLTNIQDPWKNYYTIHYFHNGSPDVNDNIRLGDLDLNSYMNHGTLHYAGPNTTSGTTSESVSVDLGASFGYSGGPSAIITSNVSHTWSYSIPDVSIVTTFTTYEGKTHHDVDETKNVGLGYTGEPGVVMSCPSTDGYVNLTAHSNMYTYKKVNHLFWTSYEDRQLDWFSVDIWIHNELMSADEIILH